MKKWHIYKFELNGHKEDNFPVKGVLLLVLLGITFLLPLSGLFLETENSHLNDPKSRSFERYLRIINT